MTSARWKRIERLFDEALKLEPDQRDAYLEHECGADRETRDEVRVLLAAEASEDRYLSDLSRRARKDLDSTESPPRGPESSAMSLEEHSFASAGSYRILREIGRGGMGRVYLAERAGAQFKQEVALKVVKRGMDSELVLQRFLRERQILARLQHPNIARFFDGGLTDEGQPYFAMEYVAGRRITDYCDAHRLGVRERLQLFLEVCDALQYAHRNLVVHRDLKPSNILVSESGADRGVGHVKLLDFGIAKLLTVGGDDADGSDDAGQGNAETLTATGMQAMTPEYASPEQVRGEPVTTAADVYALGVILYELVSGERPYRIDSKTPEEVARVVLTETPPSPSSVAGGTRKFEGDLDTICLMALRKEPERRYPSAEALAQDIKRYLAGLPVTARRDTASYRVRRFVGRHKSGVAAAVFVVLSLAAGLAFALAQARDAREQRDVARQETEKAEQALDFMVRVFEVADPKLTGGKLLSAKEILERGSKFIVDELPDQPELQATLYSAVGRAYQSMGQLEEARPFLERSLAQRTEVLGADHPDVAAGLARVANLTRLEGDLETAETLFREALELQQRIHGDEHERIATTLDLIGLLLVQSNRPREAFDYHRRALALRRKLLPADHRDIAVSLNNLSGVSGNLGELDAAITYSRDAIAIWRAALGELHPDLGVALNNLARLLREQGDLDAAEPLYREALGIWRANYGDDHPNVAVILGNLAALLRTRGDLEAAEPLYRETLAIARRTLGAGHPNLAVSVNNLGKLLHDQGKLDAAESSFKEAVAIWRRAYGNDHSRVMIGVSNLADVLVDKHELDAAESLYIEALDIGAEVQQPGHPRIAAALQGLGRVALARDLAERAEPLQREALDMLRAYYGPDDVRTAEGAQLLAESLIALAEFTEAKTLLAASARTLESAYGANDERTRAARKALSSLSTDSGQPISASFERSTD